MVTNGYAGRVWLTGAYDRSRVGVAVRRRATLGEPIPSSFAILETALPLLSTSSWRFKWADTPDMTESKPHDHTSTNCHHCGSALPDGRALLTLDEAAPRLGMNVRQLREHVREGEVQHRRRGGRYFMLWPDDFETFIESLCVPAS